jgi:mercuric ion transport protein
MRSDNVTKTTLFGGTLAALAASACCLLPLVLVSLGIGGAWISTLTRLEPFRPLFIAVALICMTLAYKKIYRAPPPEHCEPGTLCALPQTNKTYRVLFWVVSVLVLVALAYPYLITLAE